MTYRSPGSPDFGKQDIPLDGCLHCPPQQGHTTAWHEAYYPYRVDEGLILIRALDEAEARVNALEEARDKFARALTEYAVHFGDCPFDSWNESLTRCKCGLFQLLVKARAALEGADR